MPARYKRILAWVLLVGSLIGWPVSLFTFAEEEPPWVLSLSWLALIFSALGDVWVAKVEEHEEEKK